MGKGRTNILAGTERILDPKLIRGGVMLQEGLVLGKVCWSVKQVCD